MSTTPTPTLKATPGRAFLAFAGPAEQGAFCAWLSECVARSGGRERAAEQSGVHKDTLSKYLSARSVPSRASVVKLMDSSIIVGWESPEQLASHVPWLDDKYVVQAKAKAKAKVRQKAAPEKKSPEPPLELELELPSSDAGENLMDAILREPGLTAQQRATLAAVIAMVVNGVPVNVSISPLPRGLVA